MQITFVTNKNQQRWMDVGSQLLPSLPLQVHISNNYKMNANMQNKMI